MTRFLVFSAILSLFSHGSIAQVLLGDDLKGTNGDFIPFYAQDTGVAIASSQMNSYWQVARNQFFQTNGRYPVESTTDSTGKLQPRDLERARAIVDVVSKHLADPCFHPENPSLPRLFQASEQYATASVAKNPITIIQLATASSPTNSQYPGVLCTWQNIAAAGIMNHIGLHARLIDVEGHTGLEYFSYEFGKWVWMDATFNEHYVRTSAPNTPLGVSELNELTLSNQISLVQAVKHGVPSGQYANGKYITSFPRGFLQFAPTMFMSFYANGMKISRLDTYVYQPVLPEFSNSNLTGGWLVWPKTTNRTNLDYPVDRLSATIYPRTGEPNTDATQNQFVRVKFVSMLPYTTKLQARTPTDSSWRDIHGFTVPSTHPAAITLDFGFWYWGSSNENIRVRAVDAAGNATKEVSFRLRPT